MTERDIIQNLIFQLGQSQDDRLSPELESHFVEIDERTTAELLQFTRSLAEWVNYYRHHPATPVGNWRNFFPEDGAIAELSNAKTPPNLALFLAFLELYQQPQSIIDRITTRHLDFYYQKVLGLQKKGAIADKVHLLLDLKKNAAPLRILPEHLFSAGKDATKVELIYAPTRETIVNAAQVESLRSLFFDRQGGGAIRSAAIANSADGLGGKLAGNEPKWWGFGHSSLPWARIGFAIASPVLRLKEGTRTITVSLQLDRSQLNNSSLQNAFDVFLTGAKNWLGPYTVSPELDAGNVLGFSFTLLETEKAVVDYNPAIHGDSYPVRSPILQVVLRANHPYNPFRNATLKTAAVAVEVSQITSLHLESDRGILDAQRAFFPFDVQPRKDSRFWVGYPEALGKKLSDIALTIQWKNAPENFSDYYRDYGVEIANHSFKARVSFQDGVSWVNTSNGVQLFDSHNAALPHTLRFSARSVSGSPRITESMTIDPLNRESGVWARDNAKELVQQNPAFSGVSESEPGAIAFSLEQDFFHTTYPQKNLENILKYSQGEIDNPIILNEPYTPEIQRLSLAYKAHSDTVAIASTDLKDCAHPDLQFFHLTPFGLVREHGYQRQQIEARLQAGIGWAVPLLPQYNHAGELAIGFSSLKAGDSVSVLFQVSEGSADPDLPWEELHWFVLCDNYWKPLSRSEVVGDTTNQLRRSGIIQFLIPLEATTENTILPRDLIWIKGAIQNNVTAVCQLIEVAANAIEVQFVDRGNDPQHLLTALEPLKIEKLKHGLSAIKAVKQPYASFGGRGRESDRAFYTRVSERLRHKNRCLTAWDYERIVLAAFPRVYQVKCIPHAQENSWLAPGHVLLVVVPDLKNKNAINRLEPKVDADTLDRIADYVKKRAGMQVQIAVKNPRYQKIQLDFKVKFHVGYEFNDSRTRLAGEIIQFLSPWVDRRDRTLSFGGKIYKSVLLDFIEDLGFVDYVTDFKMYSFGGEETNHNDINEVLPATPDTILVSHSTHLIDPAIAVP